VNERGKARDASLRRMALVLLVGLCAGCSAQHLRYEQGALLRTETKQADSTWYPRVGWREELQVPAPYLAVWVETPSEPPTLVRRVYEKAQVTSVPGEWRFQPRFFLWPLSVARTSAGMAGWAFSWANKGLHWGAFWVVGIPVGAVTALGYCVVTTPVHLVFGEPKNYTGAEAGIGWFFGSACITTGVLETFLLPLDVVHTVLHRRPTWYAVFRTVTDHDTDLDPWADAIERQWRFAWGGKRCPPLPYWPERHEERRVMVGQQLPGEWEARLDGVRWERVDAQSVVLEIGEHVEELAPTDGEYRIDLRKVEYRCRARGLTRFRVRAQAAGRTAVREFDLTDLGYIPRNR
jgi:hypothetical protein